MTHLTVGDGICLTAWVWSCSQGFGRWLPNTHPPRHLSSSIVAGCKSPQGCAQQARTETQKSAFRNCRAASSCHRSLTLESSSLCVSCVSSRIIVAFLCGSNALQFLETLYYAFGITVHRKSFSSMGLRRTSKKLNGIKLWRLAFPKYPQIWFLCILTHFCPWFSEGWNHLSKVNVLENNNISVSLKILTQWDCQKKKK